MKYSEDHLWTNLEDDTCTVGISNFAQGELGEIAYIEIAEAGSHIEKGEPFGSIDSLKSSSDLYAPFSLTVVAPNPAVIAEGDGSEGGDPTLINRDAEGEGWIALVRPDRAEDNELLMNEISYQEYIGE